MDRFRAVLFLVVIKNCRKNVSFLIKKLFILI